MNEKLESAKNEIAKELNYNDWNHLNKDKIKLYTENLMDKVAMRYHELMT